MYKIDEQKIIDWAYKKLPNPNNIQSKFICVFVNSYVGEPDFVDRYVYIELNNGDVLTIDKLEKDIIYEVVFSKLDDKWEYLGIREGGFILKL